MKISSLLPGLMNVFFFGFILEFGSRVEVCR